jgi:serine phosphatase RsbU (regulator of sigma subunit)/putative methionine-R-sulfoxide reductase with GAF domain
LWIVLIVASLALVTLALLLRRVQKSRRLLERRVAELSALSEAGRAIVAAQLDVDELYTLIYHQARQIVDTWIFQLGLFEGDNYHIKVWIRRGERQPEAVFDLNEGQGIVGWMRQTGQPLLVHNFETEMDALPARPRYLSQDPPHSAVFVPLVTGETVIGALAIQSDRPNAFTPDHQRVLSIIANQAAAAIANARLYQTEQRRRHIADTLRQVATLTSSSLEIDDVLNGVLEGLARLVTYDAAAILLLDDDNSLTLRAARGLPALIEATGQNWPLMDSQRIRRLAEVQQAQLFGPHDEAGAYHQLLAFPPDHSCLGAPISVRERLIGVLAVDCVEPGRYNDEDKALVAALASQAASALENARLYAAGQEEAWISTALLAVAEATSLAEDIDEILETVARITPMLVGVDRCVILLWNEDVQACQVASAYQTAEDEAELQVGQVIPPGTWLLLDQLWESESPVVDEFGSLPGAPTTQDVETTLLALPLRAQGELYGAMVIGFTGQVSFTEHRTKLIAGIANQAALAIESAQLAIAQQEEAWVSLALLQVAEAVGTMSELDDVLAVVARLTPLLVGVESCLIYLWDTAQEVYVPGAAYGLRQDQQSAFNSTPIPVSGWPELSPADLDQDREQSLSRGQLLLVPGPPRPIAQGLGLCAPLALPLLAWGELMGALVVDTRDDDAQLGQRRLNILAGVAQQTATAIQNARLYVEAVERQKLERELQLARQIQASFLPDKLPQVPGWDLAAHWQGARQVSGDFYDFVPLPADGYPDGRWGFVVADVADKGMPAALFMALSRTLVRTMAIGGRDPAEVLAQANDMIMADSRSDLFVTLFYAILDPGRGALSYANAGHNPPLLFRRDPNQVIPLEAHGMAMGVLTGIELEQREIEMEPGDVLLFYTDGLTDALDGEMDEFGLKRLCSVVEKHHEASAAGVVEAINRAVAEFVGDTPQFDDLTLVVLKRQRQRSPAEA